jgi:hypothetical protein
MPRFRVEYHGSVDVEADRELDAEVNASFDCKPENCRATCLDEEGSEVSDE